MITGTTRIFCIFGYPVHHTFSPRMHNAAFKKIGLDACYVPFAVPPGSLKETVRAVIPLGICGLNITVPHKEKVISYLDSLSEEAQLIGAVNTIEVKNNKLIGHNTDGRGFLRSLKESSRLVPRNKNFVFIGSGGAARAVGFSLALAGASSIVFRDLDERKASRLANDIRQKTGVNAYAVGANHFTEHVAAADCLINATPLGLKRTDPLPLLPSLIQKKHLVCDLVYNPPKTGLLLAADKRGAQTLSGIGMLLYQGVIAFEIWTGEKAPVQTMKTELARQMR